MEVQVIKVATAIEMREAVLEAVHEASALIMAAAVADYRPSSEEPQKIKKDRRTLSLRLERNPDILMDASGSFIKVGFAAESEDLLENSKEKVSKKSLDLIVANDITAEASGFGSDTNKVLLIDKDGDVEDLPLMSKHAIADRYWTVLESC